MKNKSWLKVVYSFGTLVMLAPNFITAGTVVAETIDTQVTQASSTVESSATEQGKDEGTASSVSAEKVQDAEEKVEEKAVVTTPETEEVTTKEEAKAADAEKAKPVAEAKTEEAKAEETKATITEEQLAALKAKLPEGSEVTFANNKLTVKLPAGVEPEVGKKAVTELGLQKLAEVEVQAKKEETISPATPSDINTKPLSYRFGYQVFLEDMSKASTSMDVIAKVLSGETKIINPNSTDFVNGSKNGNDIYYFSTDQRFTSTKTGAGWRDEYQGVSVASEFLLGYEHARQMYVSELDRYVKQIEVNSKEYKADVANHSSYNPDAASDLKGLLGDISGGLTAIINVINNLFGPLSGVVWDYSPASGTDIQPSANVSVARTMQTTKKNMLDLINTIMPTVQNILIKQTLLDPRAIGGSSGVVLPVNLTKALEENNSGLLSIVNKMGFNEAITSDVSRRIYEALRDNIKAVLVENGIEGSIRYMHYALSGDANYFLKTTGLTRPRKLSDGIGLGPISVTNFVDQPWDKGTITNLAYNAGYQLSLNFIEPLRKLAIEDAFKGKDQSETDLLDGLFLTNNNFKNNKAKIMDASGADARKVMYTMYKAEYDAVLAAIEDYKQKPGEFPTSEKRYYTHPTYTEDFTSASGRPAYDDVPDNPEDKSTQGIQIEITDYNRVRTWLFKVGYEQVEKGIRAADDKSHQQANTDLAGNVKSLSIGDISNDKILKSAATTWDKDTITAMNLSTDNKNKLFDVVKYAYMYGYNSEALKVNASFAKGIESFDEFKETLPSQGVASFGFQAMENIDSNHIFHSKVDKYGKQTEFDFKYAPFGYSDNRDDISGRISERDTNKVIELKSNINSTAPWKGIAFTDGLNKAVKDRVVKVRFKPEAFPGQETEFSKVEDQLRDGFTIGGMFIPVSDDFMRYVDLGKAYATTGKATVTVNFPVLQEWEPSKDSIELEMNNQVIKTVADYKVDMSIGKFSLNKEYNDTEIVTYSKLVRPEIHDFTALGTQNNVIVSGDVTKKDSSELLDPKYTFVNIYKAGTTIDTATGQAVKTLIGENIPVNEKGHFEMPISDVQNGDTLYATAVFTNNTFKHPGLSDQVTTTVKIISDDTPTKLSFEDGSKDYSLPKVYKGLKVPAVKVNWNDDGVNDELRFKVFKGDELVAVYPSTDQTIKVDESKKGQFEVQIPAKYVNEDKNTFLIKAYFIKDGREYISSTSESQIVLHIDPIEGVLSFSVSATPIDNVEGLYWKTAASSRTKIVDRVQGNNLTLSVLDTRSPDKKNKEWAITADYDKNIDSRLNFVWGTDQNNSLINKTKVFEATTVTPNSDETEWTKTYNADQGVLLKTNEAIAVGKYATSNNQSSAITWTLHDTYKPE